MDYKIIAKTALDGKVWHVVAAQTWRGLQFVSKHKTVEAAKAAVEMYEKNPPLLGYMM